jgi:hypothetical protein
MVSNSLAISLTFVPISLDAKFGEFTMPHNEQGQLLIDIVNSLKG